jgi:hypothetical protein
MLVRSVLASATLFLASFAAPAYAEPAQTPAPFRSVEAQAFTTEELQNFGLTAQEAATGVELQAKGYRLVALTPEEAKADHPGDRITGSWPRNWRPLH